MHRKHDTLLWRGRTGGGGTWPRYNHTFMKSTGRTLTCWSCPRSWPCLSPFSWTSWRSRWVLQRSHKSLTLACSLTPSSSPSSSPCGSHSVSPLPLAPLKHTLARAHSRQHGDSPSQTGEQVCHHPDIHLSRGGPDRPVSCTLPPCPSFSPGPWHTLRSLSGCRGPLITRDALFIGLEGQWIPAGLETTKHFKTLFHSSEWHALGKKTALNEGVRRHIREQWVISGQ